MSEAEPVTDTEEKQSGQIAEAVENASGAAENASGAAEILGIIANSDGVTFDTLLSACSLSFGELSEILADLEISGAVFLRCGRNIHGKEGAAMNRSQLDKYITDYYGVRAERLFEKNPGFQVYRHNDTKKWFAMIMDLPESILGLDGQKIIDVVNLARPYPHRIAEAGAGLLSCVSYE